MLACMTDAGSERKVFITFEIWIFLLQKRMDSLQEAFIHPPEPCEACFIMDARALFDVFWTVEQKHPPTAKITLRTLILKVWYAFYWYAEESLT